MRQTSRQAVPLSTFLIALTAALAVWASAGQLSVISAQRPADRLAFLPAAGWLAVMVVAAMLVAVAMRRRPQWFSIFALSALIGLPWLPFRIPPAFYLWTGPLRSWLWIAIVTAVAAIAIGRRAPQVLASRVTDPRRAPWVAAMLAAALYVVAAHQVFRQLPAGDEPHYLVITQSLLRDRDLRIENNHLAGAYHEYYPIDLKPDYLRRGANGQIYSVHAPGLAVIVLPVFALFGYPGVVCFLAVLSGVATALAWKAVWRLTTDVAASWFGWAAVALSAPFFFHAFVAYPDAPGAALIMFAVLVMMAGPEASIGRLTLAGLALGLLPWLHTRFALAAAALGVALALRQRGTPSFVRRLAALFTPPAICACAWFAFFYAIYGTPDPRAPYAGIAQSALASLPRGVIGLLFDQQFGLLPNSPVYLCVLIGFGALARRHLRLSIELLTLLVPYGLVVAAFHMWWGGNSSPARFLVPVLLPLAIPAGAWFHAADRGGRALGLASLLVSVLITATLALVDRGSLLYNNRDGHSLLLSWLSPVVNLTTALPSSFQSDAGGVLLRAVVWLGAVAIMGAAVRMLARRVTCVAHIVVGLGAVASVSLMIAVTTVWAINDARPITPTKGAVALLHRIDPDRRQIAIGYAPLKHLALGELVARVPLADIALPSRLPDEPAIFIEDPPAAAYVVEAMVTQTGGGNVWVTLDRRYGPAWRWNIDVGRGIWRREFHLPVGVPALLVDADAAARRSIGRLSIRAVRVDGSRERLTTAQPAHVVRYGSTIVFLMAGRAEMESGGAWITGRADFVIAREANQPLRLGVRNVPVDNQVTIETDAWRRDLAMSPGETRTIDLALASDRSAMRLRVSAGRAARPADFEKGSTDTRLLGVWVELK